MLGGHPSLATNWQLSGSANDSASNIASAVARGFSAAASARSSSFPLALASSAASPCPKSDSSARSATGAIDGSNPRVPPSELDRLAAAEGELDGFDPPPRAELPKRRPPPMAPSDGSYSERRYSSPIFSPRFSAAAILFAAATALCSAASSHAAARRSNASTWRISARRAFFASLESPFMDTSISTSEAIASPPSRVAMSHSWSSGKPMSLASWAAVRPAPFTRVFRAPSLSRWRHMGSCRARAATCNAASPTMFWWLSTLKTASSLPPKESRTN
mmetsp:Transcript_7105/g.16249  ORF Transcript_7105/g.16249 Transcript_7105/m.16249 type:complete len:276 (-) Transcript_7105:1246-2073(-)